MAFLDLGFLCFLCRMATASRVAQLGWCCCAKPHVRPHNFSFHPSITIPIHFVLITQTSLAYLISAITDLVI